MKTLIRKIWLRDWIYTYLVNSLNFVVYFLCYLLISVITLVFYYILHTHTFSDFNVWGTDKMRHWVGGQTILSFVSWSLYQRMLMWLFHNIGVEIQRQAKCVLHLRDLIYLWQTFSVYHNVPAGIVFTLFPWSKRRWIRRVMIALPLFEFKIFSFIFEYWHHEIHATYWFWAPHGVPSH